MAHSEMPCQEITINQKALFLREFEKWLMHYLECSQESGKADAIQEAVAAFRASMKAKADYHQNLAGLDEGSKYHNDIAGIYSALAR
jgi:hypothetical protein